MVPPTSPLTCFRYLAVQFMFYKFLANDLITMVASPSSKSRVICVWNLRCLRIRLKQSMRSTKCDMCVLCQEALNQKRRGSVTGWFSDAMKVVNQSLDDHHEVSCIFNVFTSVSFKFRAKLQNTAAVTAAKVPIILPRSTLA